MHACMHAYLLRHPQPPSHLGNLHVILVLVELRVVRCVDSVLQDGVVQNGVVVRVACERVPLRVSERAGAADHGQLADRLRHLVPAEDADGAAVEPPRREVEVEVHRDGVHRHVGGGGEPLHSPDGA